MKQKGVIRCVFLLLLLVLFAIPVSAEGEIREEEVEGGWQDFVATIPPEVAELLPQGLLSTDLGEVAAGASEASGLSAVLQTVGRLTGLAIRENLALVARICGILLLSAVFRTAIPKGKCEGALSLLGAAVLAVMLVGDVAGRFAEIGSYFGVIRGLCVAILPLMGLLYAMGGNVAAAVANQAVMAAFLAVLEVICSGTVVPVASICVVLALVEAVSGTVSFRPLAGLIKRTYTWGFSLLMMLLCGVLGLQSTLAKGADTLALRTVRFAAGSFLPVVGGSISETLRTVSGSVAYLRGVVGVGAITVVFFAFLPMFLSVLLTRLAFSLSASAAALLSCSREEKLLSELASVWGYFLAVIASLFVMTFFSLTLLSHCASPLSLS